MTYDLIISLLIFALVGSLTPGPNNIMLLASGMNYGIRRTLPHMLGIWLGFPAMVLLIGLGLAQIFDLFPASLQLLKLISTIYLLYLAWRIATAKSPTASELSLDQQDSTQQGSTQPSSTKSNSTKPGQVKKSRPLTFLEAATFQWINPKGWTVSLSAISLYTPPDHPLESIFIVTLIFAGVSIPSASLWVILGHKLRSLIEDEKKLKAFNILCALLLVASLYPILIA